MRYCSTSSAPARAAIVMSGVPSMYAGAGTSWLTLTTLFSTAPRT